MLSPRVAFLGWVCGIQLFLYRYLFPGSTLYYPQGQTGTLHTSLICQQLLFWIAILVLVVHEHEGWCYDLSIRYEMIRLCYDIWIANEEYDTIEKLRVLVVIYNASWSGFFSKWVYLVIGEMGELFFLPNHCYPELQSPVAKSFLPPSPRTCIYSKWIVEIRSNQVGAI